MTQLIEVREAAALLRVSPHTIYRLVARGELKCRKIGDRTLFTQKDLDDLVERSGRRRQPAAA